MRKSNDEHLAAGTFRPHRHAGRMQLPTTIPAKPEMTGRAAELWDAIAAELYAAGHINAICGIALKLLAESLALYETATADILKSGLTAQFTNKGGHTSTVANPSVRIRSDAAKQVFLLLKEFGMTPKAVSTMRTSDVLPSDGDDSVQEYLRRLTSDN